MKNNNMSAGKNILRKEGWDFAKTILIFIIIYGHVCPAIDGDGYKEKWIALTRITGLFVMPCWFFISGYFQSNIDSGKVFVGKIIKSSRRILVPLAVWGG